MTVRDCGSGIELCDLPHITDRFFTGTSSKGSGLGLAIAEAAIGQAGFSLAFRAAQPSGQIVHLSGLRGTAGS